MNAARCNSALAWPVARRCWPAVSFLLLLPSFCRSADAVLEPSGAVPAAATAPAGAAPAVLPAVASLPIAPERPLLAGEELARAKLLADEALIYRDDWGVPHVDAQTNDAAVFAFAYAQAEDYFWQVEDNFILSLGRYSEVHGSKGLNSDLLNRAFEIVRNARATYDHTDAEVHAICESFALGLNYYLLTHPEVTPRLIKRFEPWHVLALGRHMTIELCFRYTRLQSSYMPRTHRIIWPATGSNGWAIAPSRTASGHAMLLVNPHQPWFGFGQLYEGHVRSQEGGWNFSGGTLFGNPLFVVGHNEHLGWTLTTNEPDIADVWRVTFDDPAHPLRYRYDGGYREAVEWPETILVRSGQTMNRREYTFRKTHHGPIVVREDEQHFLAANIAGLQGTLLLSQTLQMMKSQELGQFKAAVGMLQFPIMNVMYADQAGNIFYLYGGRVPKRDPQFNWSLPVDGSDPRTTWQGVHTADELPQVLNPAGGYVQNCNSSPFTTTLVGNPDRSAFPSYMIEDADDDKRRAKRSRQLLEGLEDATFEDVMAAAFDTTIYWAQSELPRYAQRFEDLKTRDPELAARVEPYFTHLVNWDCRITARSTQATLCEEWYELLHGLDYPAEKLLPEFVADPDLEFRALIQAAAKLQSMHGTWRVPWGELFRAQRKENVAELLALPFADSRPSLPCLAGPGPMGVVYTAYYTPSIRVPLIKTLRKRYGLIGATYMALYEFGPRIRGASLLNFGECGGDPNSPHFFDQAKLLSEQKMKPELFYWDDVVAGAKVAYHPGQRTAALARAAAEVQAAAPAKVEKK